MVTHGTSYGSQKVISGRAVPVIKADADLPNGMARSLLIGVAGTINVTFPDGSTADNMPAQAGLFRYYVTRVRPGGSADNIWANY